MGYVKMKCEDCNINMEHIERKEMINKVCDKYRCPRCKNILNKAIASVDKNTQKKQ